MQPLLKLSHEFRIHLPLKQPIYRGMVSALMRAVMIALGVTALKSKLPLLT